MKKILIMLSLLLMITLSLSANVDEGKKWVVIPTGNGMNITVPYEEITNKKVSFKDIKVSSIKGKRNFVIGEGSKKYSAKGLSFSSLQGELSLKQWLFEYIDSWNVYILDETGNYIEFYSQLVYGKKYTIIDEEYKYGQMVMLGKEDIIFGDKYDGETFTFGLDIIDFDMKFKFPINGVYKDYKWLINETHYFSEEGNDYKTDLTYSVVHHYLQTGELIFNQVGNIGGFNWDLNKVSYERAKEGFELAYDSTPSIGEEKSYQINFIVENDVRIHFENSEYVNISVDGVKVNPEDIVNKGSKVEIVFTNNENLSNYIYIQEIEYIINQVGSINEFNSFISYNFDLPAGEYRLSVSGIPFDTLTYVNGNEYDDSNHYEDLWLGESIRINHSGGPLSIQVRSFLIERGYDINAYGDFSIKLEQISQLIEEECSLLDQLLGQCININLAVISEFGFLNEATMKIVVDTYNNSDIPIIKITDMTFQNDNDSTGLGGDNNVEMYLQTGEYYFTLNTDTVGTKVLTSMTFEIRYEGNENDPFTKTINGEWNLGNYYN